MRRMILILCGLVFAQASMGGTFLQDDALITDGSGMTVEVLRQSESAAAAGQALFLTWVTSDVAGDVATHSHSGTTMYHVAGGTLHAGVQDEVLLVITGDIMAGNTLSGDSR